ncbi:MULTISPECIES: ABC transporter permease [unclassified Nesterenkonia]|uniref:ABC transporter permease n=1 Tax=unclassified Nesterenkonia TaxID=2629769 RepID=UPI0009F71546|nr:MULTISPECIES: ABC transporter permease [unclassified Nesterenkonia]MDS2173484.1 ABC transporter permease [Nesterenkonia sp. CL21]OSM42735.1 nitrate ABC transporter permease [Nesterenkonia sp. PF2B19]
MTTTQPATAPARASGLAALRRLPVWRRLLTLLALPLILVVIWWVTSDRADSFFYPPLRDILATFGPTWFEGRLTADVVPSLGRLLAGYALAMVIGVGLGTAIGLSSRLRAFLEPVLEFFRAIPPPVMVPILMLFLGIGTGMKIFVIAAGAVWPILLNTVEGVRGVDEVLRDTARTYRLGRLTQLRTLVLRGATPQIVTGARQALSIAIILMVISEMFAAHNGLGFTIVQFQRSFAMPEMWTGIILLGLVGVVLSVLFRIIERPVLFWYHGQRQSHRGGN